MSVTIDSDGWIKEAIGIYYQTHTFGRFTRRPKWLVLHGTASGVGSTAQGIASNWSRTPADASNAVSTHVLINKDGSYVQGLSLLDMSWGNSGASDSPRADYLPSGNLNYCTLNMEHIKYDTQLNSDELTPAQKASSFALVRAICQWDSIPLRVVTVDDVSQGGIIRHHDCDQKYRWNCPGPYPFVELSNYLKGAPNMGAFNNQTAVDVWNSQNVYFDALKQPLPRRDTGIFNAWTDAWKAGHFKGVCVSQEYDLTLPDGSKGVAQNFGGGTCTWNKQGQAAWL